MGASPVAVQGFTGAYRAPVTGGYPLGNGYRWYLPGLMRFNAPDSFSPFDRGGINAYVYCGADPVNRLDPSGHAWELAWAADLAEESLHEETASHNLRQPQESSPIAAHTAQPAGKGAKYTEKALNLPENPTADSDDDIILNVDFVGEDGSIVYNTRLRTLEITMHGAPYNANHMSGLTLADKIKKSLLQYEGLPRVDMDSLNEVRLNCCWGAFGGELSVAQALSNSLKKTVRAYKARYSPLGSGGAYENESRLFYPARESAIKNSAHRLLHVTSEFVCLPLHRLLKR